MQASPLEKLLGWLLPLIAGLTPLVIIQAFLQPHIGQGYFLQMATFALTALFALGLISGAVPMPRRFNLFGVLLALNSILFAISTALSVTSLYSIKKALLPISALLLVIIMIGCRNRERLLSRTSWVMIGIGLLCAILGILQFFDIEFKFLNYSEEVRKNKVISTIGHPNYLSSFLGPVAFILLAKLVRKPGWKRLVPGSAAVMVLLFCIALARTRAVWLGIATALVVLIVVGLIYVMSHRGAMRYFSRMIASLVSIFAILSLVIFGMMKIGVDLELRERLVSKKEIDSRLFYWKAAIDMSAESPVFGRGYARFDPSFWDYTLEHQKQSVGRYYANMLPAISGTTPEHVHNEYIQVLCEQGIAGALGMIAMMCFFVYFGFIAILRERDHGLAFQKLFFYASLILILVDAMFSFPWRLPASLVMAALTFGLMYNVIYPAPAPEKLEASPEPPVVSEPETPPLPPGEVAPA